MADVVDLLHKVPEGTTLFIYKEDTDADRQHWWCFCFGLCGGTKMEHSVSTSNLLSKNTTSCGCFRRQVTGDRARTHGMRQDPRYPSWCQMRYRCTNPKNPEYHNYGKRGIRVCSQWQGKYGFKTFCEDMGTRPEKHTIERVQVNGNYEPSNCIWILNTEQAYNKRNTVWYTYDDVTKPVAKWAKEYGMLNQTLKHRLLVLEMDFLEAVNTAVAPRKRTYLFDGEQLLVSEIADRAGLTKGCVQSRIRRAGIPENGHVEGIIDTPYYDVTN